MEPTTSKIITLRLDYERDADLIRWLEMHERGCRSQGIRDMLRLGLGFSKQEQLLSDLDSLRQVIASELRKVLNGVQFLQKEAEPTQIGKASLVESQYGNKLDSLLSSL